MPRVRCIFGAVPGRNACYAKQVILERLKTATSRAHASLERRLRIARPNPTLSDYRAYLSAMLGFTSPLEARFADMPSELRRGAELEKRAKAHLLELDLDALDRRLGPAPRALCAAVPDTEDEAGALGALYVLEGSTLGARYLRKHLSALGIDDSSAYLDSYGDALGDMWLRLRALLVARAGADPARTGEVVAGACRTFELLDRWLVARGAAEAGEVT